MASEIYQSIQVGRLTCLISRNCYSDNVLLFELKKEFRHYMFLSCAFCCAADKNITGASSPFKEVTKRTRSVSFYNFILF